MSETGARLNRDASMATSVEDEDRREFDLHSVVVSYEDMPDRCTMYPRRKSCRERLESWLTADHSAFVDLADAR